MTENLPKAWGEGTIRIHDSEIECYVLEDGTAILNKGKMMDAIGRPWKGKSRTKYPVFVGAKNLEKYIRPELISKLKGIEFKNGNKIVSGYLADILYDVCNVYLEARQADALTTSQLPIAQKCEMLIRSFAKVGITALIHEQLGFEKYKHPDALKMLIESYLAEEVRKWSKEFPDEFFYQMDRIYDNPKTTSRNRPRYYAGFINKHIYNPIEDGKLLDELDKRNPTDTKGNRSKRFHQFLNTEKGILALRSQIWQVLALLKTSHNKRSFEGKFDRLMGFDLQLPLFEDDELSK